MIAPPRKLLEWSENTGTDNLIFLFVSIALVLFAGLMSGLTLGLMSLDKVDMEVLVRSGTPTQRKHATRILPVIQNGHFLLVTLLLCNAAAMEALPICLDRLVSPVISIVVSVTAVLMFGEVIPQAVCSRHGLAIGANLSWFVRGLMLFCSPISWPIGKLLDFLLGHKTLALFPRGQLKALVGLHGEEQGFGGKLSIDEIQIIVGALDMTSKIAYKSMTPLDRVFMLSTSDILNEATVNSILEKGHSRIPVCQDGDRNNIVGLILAKELLRYNMASDIPVSEVAMRSIPRLSAATLMYDLLKLFKTGRSHIVVLTQPEYIEDEFAPKTPVATIVGDAHLNEKGDVVLTAETTVEVATLMIPRTALSGQPIGIITIEDVIEELMQAEIVDETDQYVDNEQRVRVDLAVMTNSLPASLRAKLVRALDGSRSSRRLVQSKSNELVKDPSVRLVQNTEVKLEILGMLAPGEGMEAKLEITEKVPSPRSMEG